MSYALQWHTYAIGGHKTFHIKLSLLVAAGFLPGSIVSVKPLRKTLGF